jgi:hypothetical protein
MLATGFCHLLLQSRALVSRSFSTRSLPRARGLFRFPRSLPVPFFTRTEHSSTQRFHAAVVTVADDRFSFPSLTRAIIEPLSCLSSLLDVPACGSLRSGPHIEAAPSSLPDAIREDLAALQSGTTFIERYISSASVLRRLPRATGSRPNVASLSGFRWFCRQRAVSLRRFAVAISRCVCKRDCLG